MLRKVRAKEKAKRVSGPKNLPREDSGRIHHRDTMRRGTAGRGCSLRKHEEPSSGPEGRAKAKARVEEKPKARGKASNAAWAEGLDTPRGCAPVKDGLMTAAEGEDTSEDECWTDETLQLRYLGSESCLMSFPPGLSDAFSDAGWTVVTRKSRNRQQCSRRRGCFDKSGTVLGSLWDDDDDMIWGKLLTTEERKEW